VSHGNAFLSPRGRLALARCVVVDGWSLRRAAERFQTSVPTVQRWARQLRHPGPTGTRTSTPTTRPPSTIKAGFWATGSSQPTTPAIGTSWVDAQPRPDSRDRR
jgi:hypothetical protein